MIVIGEGGCRHWEKEKANQMWMKLIRMGEGTVRKSSDKGGVQMEKGTEKKTVI